MKTQKKKERPGFSNCMYRYYTSNTIASKKRKGWDGSCSCPDHLPDMLEKVTAKLVVTEKLESWLSAMHRKQGPNAMLRVKYRRSPLGQPPVNARTTARRPVPRASVKNPFPLLVPGVPAPVKSCLATRPTYATIVSGKGQKMVPTCPEPPADHRQAPRPAEPSASKKTEGPAESAVNTSLAQSEEASELATPVKTVVQSAGTDKPALPNAQIAPNAKPATTAEPLIKPSLIRLEEDPSGMSAASPKSDEQKDEIDPNSPTGPSDETPAPVKLSSRLMAAAPNQLATLLMSPGVNVTIAIAHTPEQPFVSVQHSPSVKSADPVVSSRAVETVPPGSPAADSRPAKAAAPARTPLSAKRTVVGVPPRPVRSRSLSDPMFAPLLQLSEENALKAFEKPQASITRRKF